MSDFRVNTKLGLKKKTGQKGQISVFLALGFLVLFTMFAMTINVGMVVHDKINIQNATDFAAIYVAQRQAEMLNAIAHMNYQIRQAHKLLAYRYVVLGTAGIDPNRDVDFNEGTPDLLADKIRFPACVSDRKIMNYPRGQTDEWCNSTFFSNRFPGLPTLRVVNTGLGGNSGYRNVTVDVARGIRNAAGRASAINWWFVANIMASYKNQIAYRKAMIKALARNLTRPIEAGNNGMKDLYGDSVYEGARKTFEFNLSESSRRSGGFSIQIRNSIAAIPVQQWLPEISVVFLPFYAEFETASSIGALDALVPRAFIDYPTLYSDSAIRVGIDDFLDQVDPGDILTSMLGPFPEGDDLEDILGFEKNPWYMVYSEVQAEVVSGALFSPLPNVRLQANAYAKPFGGRIGPWFGQEWPRGSNISSNDKREPLWPNRRAGAGLPTAIDPTLLPNAPKYPGDENGYTTRMAQSSTGLLGNRSLANRFDINDYTNITTNLLPGGDAQALSALDFMRFKELSAIAPDLFDITYYSIESNFHENYLEEKLDTWLPQEANQLFTRGGISYNRPIWRDIGHSSLPALQQFNIRNQLISTERQNFARDVFYFLDASAEGLANVLTSWVGGTDVMDYRSPSSGSVRDRFGRCGTPYTASGSRPNIPGECLSAGGRTGYSVKLVSRDYLESSQHRMSPGSTGAILNPPQN